MSKFYITNAIPYVNAKPHVGHALEFIQSDAISRYHKELGDDVLLLCGGDENALKNVQAAQKEGEDIQKFVDKNTNLFYELSQKLDVVFDVWQKGSDKTHHFVSSQKLWEACVKNGDIYKKKYKGLYCLGCEAFYTKDELNQNLECFEHPGTKLEEVEEENYFFSLSRYQDKITQLIKSDTYKIVPEFRKNEILSFLKNPLEDISISRSNARAKNWGVPVPGDDSQRLYVWFDALNIYQSGIGYGWDEKKYDKWWPADLHVIGKGIIRFHAIYWPAFLLSAGLSLPKKLFVHEYFTVNGQKMSKSVGNVIDPIDLINEFGKDAVRYFFLAKFSPFLDGDFSKDKFTISYNSDLANGLGNVVSRVATLCQNFEIENNSSDYHEIDKKQYDEAMNNFEFNNALAFIWKKISNLDKYINETEPWKLAKTDRAKGKEVISHAVDEIEEIAILLKPFLPSTSEKILNQFQGKILPSEPLFPRLS